jgi:hypothetical protein
MLKFTHPLLQIFLSFYSIYKFCALQQFLGNKSSYAFILIYVYFEKEYIFDNAKQQCTQVSRKIHHVATLNGSISTSNAKLQLII